MHNISQLTSPHLFLLLRFPLHLVALAFTELCCVLKSKSEQDRAVCGGGGGRELYYQVASYYPSSSPPTSTDAPHRRSNSYNSHLIIFIFSSLLNTQLSRFNSFYARYLLSEIKWTPANGNCLQSWYISSSVRDVGVTFSIGNVTIAVCWCLLYFACHQSLKRESECCEGVISKV